MDNLAVHKVSGVEERTALIEVIEDAIEINVTLLDGREFKAQILGRDPDTDIAVIKVDAQDLTSISLGDSSKLQVGDFVVAIGNPFGLVTYMTRLRYSSRSHCEDSTLGKQKEQSLSGAFHNWL